MPGERILIVDDNPMNVKLASVAMSSEGYVVETASDAHETLAKIRSFRPLLILMDIQLPGMDGLELTRWIKADPTSRDVVILALTAHAVEGYEERARAAGCDGYIAKPIDTRALPSVVAEHLRPKPSTDAEGGPP
jgi:two-component system cell cycle response regulator DivK